MKATLWIIIVSLITACSTSKKVTEKQKETTNETTREQVKEVITEPLISYIEVPVDCRENIAKQNKGFEKTYQLQSGKTSVEAQIKGNMLRIKTENKGQSSRDKVTEKIVTVDKIHFRDKVKKVPYIPKWIWALLAFNVIYFGWKYKNIFSWMPRL